MSRAIISRERIDCDMCHEYDIGEPEIVSVNGVSCDICYECRDHFKRSVAFLVKFCDLKISYVEDKE